MPTCLGLLASSLLLAALLPMTSAHAEEPRFVFSVPMTVAVPVTQDAFTTSPWIGASGALGLAWEEMPFPMYIGLRALGMGAVTTNQEIERRFGQGTDAVGLVTGTLLVRVYSPPAILRGYVEGSAGLAYLYAGVSSDPDDDNGSVSVLSDEITGAFGGAAGVLVRVGHGEQDLYVDARVAYEGLADPRTAQNPGLGRVQLGLGLHVFFDL